MLLPQSFFHSTVATEATARILSCRHGCIFYQGDDWLCLFYLVNTFGLEALDLIANFEEWSLPDKVLKCPCNSRR